MGIILITVLAVCLNLATRFACDWLGVPHDTAITLATIASTIPIAAYVFRERGQ